MSPSTPPSPRPPRFLNWPQVLLLYTRELRTAFREPNLVVNSLLIPLILYPLLLWMALSGLTFVQGQTQGYSTRLLVRGSLPTEHRRFLLDLDRHPAIQRLSPDSPEASDPHQALQDGRLDAILTLHPHPSQPNPFSAHLDFNASRVRSVTARDHLQQLLDQYRLRWLAQTATQLGVPPSQWQGFDVTDHNVASQRQMGGFILGLTLPAFFIIAIAVGCFHPAIDTIAGERERGTWETLMSTAAHRPSLAAAKFLYVATFGGLAGLLNLAALALTLRPVLAPLLADGDHAIHFSPPLAAWPVAALAALLMAAFVAAGMLALALFARTFTEGQSLLTPFFLILVVPTLFLQTPGISFSPTLACVPVVNVGLMLRSAFAGSYPPLPIALTSLVTSLLVVLILRAGAARLASLDILDHPRSSTGRRSWLRILRLHPTSPTPPRP